MMPEWFIKLLPWMVTGGLGLAMAWGVLKTTVSSLKTTVSSLKTSFEDEKKLNESVNDKLFEKIDRVHDIVSDSTAELRLLRENDRSSQDNRNSSLDVRMNALDRRSNLIAGSNQKLTNTVETMSDRMESLTRAVLDDMGKKPNN